MAARYSVSWCLQQCDGGSQALTAGEALDTGECTSAEKYLGYLTINGTFFFQMLKKFGGLGVVWEHRYVTCFAVRTIATVGEC